MNKRLKEKELNIELTDEAKNCIAEEGYDPVYGARPLKRYIQKSVETSTARLILSGEVDMGDTILIDVKEGEIRARKK